MAHAQDQLAPRKTIDQQLTEHGLTAEDVHLPARGVAVFGRTGTGKSSLFYFSRFVRVIMIADTGSAAHSLYFDGEVVTIDPTLALSPIEQVESIVARCAQAGQLWLLDSWTTLQEQQVAWKKLANRRRQRSSNAPAISIRDHQEIVGDLRDLALILSLGQGFTVFNTSPGGKGKTPEGQEVIFPAGCITGYPSLNGTGLNSETILARWSNVWGVFQGYRSDARNIPRGLYVPGSDIRPAEHASYAPLKDPLMLIHDTSEAGIMQVPDLRLPENHGRCFVDELLVEAARRWPRRKRPVAEPAAAAVEVPPVRLVESAPPPEGAPVTPIQRAPKGGVR